MKTPKPTAEQKAAEARAKSDRFRAIQEDLENRTSAFSRAYTSRRSLITGNPAMVRGQ